MLPPVLLTFLHAPVHEKDSKLYSLILTLHSTYANHAFSCVTIRTKISETRRKKRCNFNLFVAASHR